MKLSLAALLVVAAPAWADESPWRGSMGIESAHHYQGLAQNEGNASVNGSLAYRTKADVAVGIWAGKYSLPVYDGASAEVDYFVSWGHELAFNKRIETSLWRYTYTNPDYRKYEWSQWLTSFHLDERFSLTVGLSDHLFLSNRVSVFSAFTARQSTGPLTFALSLGWNEMSGSPLHSFQYAQFKTVYSFGRWQLFADYSQAFNARDRLASRLVHEGASAGIMRVF